MTQTGEIAVEAQGAQTFSSIILNLNTRDKGIKLTNIKVYDDRGENDGQLAVMTEHFGGFSYDDSTKTYTFPSSAEVWAGVANADTSIYPFIFTNPGKITFDYEVNDGVVEIFFRLENNPHPDTDPAFSTATFSCTPPPPPPPDPICFPKGTPVLTNLGPVAIEQLNSDKHTIRGKEIVAITQSRPLQKHIVCFEKDSLSKNVPSQQTLCSMEHKVFFKGEMVKARNIVDVCENVTFNPYNGETLYNVLLKKHDKMMINNLICETLHPENIMAKISTMKDGQKKNKAIQELTCIIKKNDVSGYKKLYSSLK